MNNTYKIIMSSFLLTPLANSQVAKNDSKILTREGSVLLKGAVSCGDYVHSHTASVTDEQM